MIKTSFIIIAYNEERTIGRCLDSILAQDNLEDYEIVVVDDGSKDATASIVEGYVKKNSRIVLNRLVPNQGRGAARAAGVSLAQGKHYAFIDADIVLPTNWLSTCYSYIPEFDAVGGVAVPDGDVNYVYGILNLKPKVASPTTIVSGSNGLYKSEIFSTITFNKDFRDGEDSVFNKTLIANKFKIHSIKSLIVEHREARRFFEAMKWMYQIGRGATRQLKQFKEIRLPDFAYFILIAAVIISSLVAILFKEIAFLLLPVVIILFVDIIHFRQKFYFEPRRFWRYFAGIIIYWLMLLCYFAGRTAGWFVPVPKEPQKKKVMICFDFEGQWGMPFKADYDIEETTYRLLSVLDKYNAKAVFFAVGKIIEEYPDLIKEIAQRGHEIALHGYSHEHLDKATKEDLAIFSGNLSRVEDLLEKLIGKRPMGFRAPYLMAPVFYSPELYQILTSHGYQWVSNREIRYPEELFRPDRLCIRKFWGANNWLMRTLLPILNIRMIFTENIMNKKGISHIIENIKWLNRGAVPFERNNILEVPVHSPLDCDLLGLPRPDENSSNEFINYAVTTLTAGVKRNGELYVLTFHDWIIGSANRIQVLDNTIETLSRNKDVVFVASPKT